MSIPSLMKSFANLTYKKLAPNLGNMLLITGVIGWALSSLAQITAIAINNKIPKDQKKFLVPQEIADAAVNIASFIFLTRTCQHLGENLVKSGKLATPEIRKFLFNHKLDIKIGTKNFNISNELPIKEETDKAFTKAYYKFFDGVSFIASTIGSIISCNIVTPYARNYLGAKEQKRSIAQDKMHNNIILPTSPVLPAQNRFSIDDYKSKITNVSNGSMRV